VPKTTDTREYTHHRERQRERLLAHAEALFLAHGIRNVSISDIAVAAQVTRATIYRYYTHRLEIAAVIMQRYHAVMRAAIPASVWDEQLSGAVRVTSWVHATRANFFAFPTQIAYRHQYAQYIVSERVETPSASVQAFDSHTYEVLRHILAVGVYDGSLVLPQEITKVYAMMLTTIWGFEDYLLGQQRLRFAGIADVDSATLYTNFCIVLLQGLVKNCEN
jgi:AcrR family transcriptional regulator